MFARKVQVPNRFFPPCASCAASGPGACRLRWQPMRLAGWRMLSGWLCGAMLFFCGAALGATGPRWAQLADTVFLHLSLEQGLQQQVVTALVEDRDGFLWIGTQDGLARWDGYRFRVFRRNAPDPHDALALPDNYISTLFMDVHGDIWLGTVNGGLARYQRELDRFVVLPGVLQGSVYGMASDGGNGIWVATQAGLEHISLDGKVLERLRHDPRQPDSLPDSRVQAVLRSNDGWLWVGTYRGVVRRPVLEKGTGGFRPLDLIAAPAVAPLAGHNRRADVASALLPVASLSSGASQEQPPVWRLYQDSGERVWIGTGTRGAYWIERDGTQAHALGPVGKDATSTDYVDSFAETGDGRLWVGTYGQGILELSLNQVQAGLPIPQRRIVHEQSIASSLAHNTIWTLLRDRSGQLWVGSDRGVSRHDPAQNAVLSLFSVPGRADRISDIDIHSVAAMPDGRIWLGFGERGVDILAADGGRVASLLSDNAHPDTALPRNQVVSLEAHGNQDVFIGTAQGLYRSNVAATFVKRMRVPGMGFDEQITSLLAEGEHLWLGTPNGLWRLHPRDWEQSRQVNLDLSDRRVMTMVHQQRPGHAGNLWLGTQNGLNRIDLESGKVEQFMPEPDRAGGLAAGFIPNLLLDREGRLWIATFSGGLNVLLNPGTASGGRGGNSGGAAQFRRIGIEHGLPSSNINKILQDRQGYIWVSTDDGLARIDPHDFSVHALQRADGVAIRTFWAGSGANTSHGELLFGGDSGLTVLRPELLKAWQYRPPLVLSEVRIMGQRQVLPRQHATRQGLLAQAMVLASDANGISVEFSALDYSAPEMNRYAYRLDPWDAGWVETDATRRLASYTNLPPGDYRLRLRGSNRNGVWSEPELVLPLRVLPAWYQSWWWRALLTLLVLVGMVAAVQLRTRVLRQRQHALEALVEQRTSQMEKQQELVLATNLELHDANEALNQANTGLAESGSHLQQSNAQLQATLKTLRDTQVQLVQQAKIASLGTLTAGVAHEINNPANFAFVGAYNLERQMAEFRQFLLDLAGPEAPPEILARINAHFELLGASLGSITEGTGRIRDLVKDLRTFSRLDEAEWKAVPIADSLQATVNLVRTQYAQLVEIRCELHANPELECWPAQLNQVFMHLIVNACQAIQSRFSEPVLAAVSGRANAHPVSDAADAATSAATVAAEAQHGLLVIRSFEAGDSLQLEFEDNGVGISASSIEHIFDPFFTTRTVGEGMGMGLSISFGIVQKHGGSISVRSKEGEGSCFCISLPLKLKSTRP